MKKKPEPKVASKNHRSCEKTQGVATLVYTMLSVAFLL